MTSNQEVVTYDGLPASAGGAHSLRTKNPRAAAERVQAFVDATVLTVGAPEMSFQLWAGGPPDVTGRFESFAAAHFGGPQSRQRTHTQWRVRSEDVDATLDALSGADSGAVTGHGHPLASLVWNAQVALIDPETGTSYEGIDADAFGRFAVDGYGRLLGTSGVRATFGTTASSLSLWLAFPADDRLHDAAAHVQQHLPFRMSTKHWRRWRATKDRQSYRAAKITSPLVS
ncbi:hypothetical protein [Microbacterium saperdae]|uniref:Uncharacterized protein n=1 Tax=Microbacterium saperdae TaxID=69368 RepID=A0A543BLG1_9MICO|nr:hypothetical protein [Microbacterium saperdae]TQL85667.1 hypothetical protein FB560_1298 [Microbacterium saperdae]GGM53912.1 hypothetical protein GCM10010489_26980 [Microbacterium saperdae]